MRALASEVFGFEHYLICPSDHQVGALDGTSESMGSSRIQLNIFNWESGILPTWHKHVHMSVPWI